MKSTTKYYQRVIDILDLLDEHQRGIILREIAKHSPKILVEVFDVYEASNNTQAYEAVKAIYNGCNKLDCIKAYRNVTGEGLKEAKTWVETNFRFSN